MKRFCLSLTLVVLFLSVAARAATLPKPDHIVIVIEENKGFTDVIGSGNAPYIEALAKRGTLFEKFFAQHHPSQPNYVALFAGSPLTVCDDKCPSTQFTDVNLGSELMAAGESFVGFDEDLSPKCKSGKFARKHCPWIDFSNVPASSSKDFTSFPQTAAGFAALPTLSFVIPNLVNDMHDGSTIAKQVRNGDNWLKKNLDAYAIWAMTHNSLLIVTWDEDSSSYTIHCPSVITTSPPKNRIVTLIVGEPVKVGTSTTEYDHQDLLRTILDMYGIAPFGGAVGAKDITDVWK